MTSLTSISLQVDGQLEGGSDLSKKVNFVDYCSKLDSGESIRVTKKLFKQTL